MTKAIGCWANIRRFRLLTILWAIFFSVPVLVLFWQENGLSMTEIMVLQSVFAITTVALEIPTGYLADLYGRKKTLIWGALFVLLADMLYSLGTNFWQFLLAELIWGVSAALISGSDAALVYDSLKEEDEEKEYKKVWGSITFYSLLTLALSNVAGGFIAKISYRATLYAVLPTLFLAFLVTFSLREPKRHKLIIKKGYVKKLLGVVKKLLTHPKTRWLIVYAAVLFGFNQAALWLYQPYFELTGLNLIYFGVVFALFQFVAAVAAKYAHTLEERLGKRTSLIILPILIAVSYLLMSNFIFLFSFSFAFIQQFVRGFSNPILTDYMNSLVESSLRATSLSVMSMMSQLSYAAIVPIIGYVVDIFSLVQALTILGIAVFVAAVPILFLLYKDGGLQKKVITG